jgi:hypothetical protein
MVATGDVAGVLDLSLLQDLQQLTTAVERVGKLNGYTYLRVDDGQSKQSMRVRRMGLVAQDVLKAAPESVVIADSGKLSVSYGGVIALMVEAFKALTARVVALEATVASTGDMKKEEGGFWKKEEGGFLKKEEGGFLKKEGG